jgi:hypothetical protein
MTKPTHHPSSWVKKTRISQGLKPYNKEQRNMTPDQRSFIGNLYMQHSSSDSYHPVYGYGGGRPINEKVIKPLEKRGLIKAKDWQNQKYNKKSKQVDVKLTQKGKEFGKQFHW